MRSFASHGLAARSAARNGRGREALGLVGGSGAAAEGSCFVSTSRGAAASHRMKESGGSPRAAMAAGAAQLSTAPVEKVALHLLLCEGARGRVKKEKNIG